jgi:hypothetical protein
MEAMRYGTEAYSKMVPSVSTPGTNGMEISDCAANFWLNETESQTREPGVHRELFTGLKTIMLFAKYIPKCSK